ncbi:hypothetical protein [Desulfogranum marinum]|uniref:hypothetical protein n=1 Tax=Desulfogranum marinum TaxID=453220 RepID=UPI0019650E7F|nr:hypothetical protein [Desulfogranum marinum]MBM9515049.1 hypothetical protein [Desulfogranum marinum]
MKRLFLAWSILFLAPYVHAGWFGPKNYEECILKNMKGASSNAAAYNIRAACYKKFPVKTDVPLDFSSVSMTITNLNNGEFTISIFNKSYDYCLTSIEVYPVTKSLDSKYAFQPVGQLGGQMYVNVPPRETYALRIALHDLDRNGVLWKDVTLMTGGLLGREAR